jgi:hypothetical protein
MMFASVMGQEALEELGSETKLINSPLFKIRESSFISGAITLSRLALQTLYPESSKSY